MISNPSTTQPSIFDKLELLKTGDNVARFNNCLLKRSWTFKRGQMLKITNWPIKTLLCAMPVAKVRTFSSARKPLH